MSESQRGSGFGDCVDGGGVVLEKDQRPDPAGEIVWVSPTGPSHVESNSEDKDNMKKPKQAQPKSGRKVEAAESKRHPSSMNRKQRRDLARKIQADDVRLEVVHPDAAGIDIGNEAHYVAVPPGRDSESVRRFGCVTAELKRMAEWLKQCGIRTVAMQSTGVYWIAVNPWSETKS